MFNEVRNKKHINYTQQLFGLLTLLLTFIIQSIGYSQDHWFLLNSQTNLSLKTLQFTDSLNGWVGGDSGLVMRTTNGGLDWIVQQTKTKNKIVNLFFLDENRGWGLAWQEGNPPFGTTILSTTDGGSNWAAEPYEENIFMQTIYFLDTLKGFMGGIPGGEFVFTNDGGETWRDVNVEPLPLAFFPVININFYNELYGFACGGQIDIAGVVWKTTNGGNLWTPIDPVFAPPDQIWDIHFFDSLNVICAGGDPEFFGVGFLKSSDAGETWLFNEIGVFGVARAISFRTDYEGWAPVPSGQSLLYSLDSGDTWTEIPAPGNSEIYDLVFTDSLTGYGVGDNGAIIKYKYPVWPSVNNDEQSIDDYQLFQNYPNPFNSETQISYYLPFESIIDLSLYDLRGEKLIILEKNTKPAGRYNTSLNLKNYPSGIYFYRLIASDVNPDGNSVNLSKKLILIK
jgi:photosystem II stability/assembly factor-like uncharacterized protein